MDKYEKIKHLMPKAMKTSIVSNYQFLCALLYIVENGCKWRELPEKYGKWHTIYTRFNRDNRSNVLCIDSTYVKVHPNATGALKKWPTKHRTFTIRSDNENKSMQ